MITTGFQLADLPVRAELGWSALVDYARTSADTLRWYDSPARPPVAEISLDTLGRSSFMDARLTRYDAASLMEAAETAPWGEVPVDGSLADADPAELHRHFLRGAGRVGATSISKVLHLTHPALFPILDSPIRQVYAERAQHAWEVETRSERPRSGKSYWPPIRTDLCAATDVIGSWRGRLAESDDAALQGMAGLTDVRLWDIVARQIIAAGHRLAQPTST